MSDKQPILYRYMGKGESYRNIPARDLTQVDMDRLGLIEQSAVKRGALYKQVEPPKPGKNDKQEGGDS